MGVNKLYLAIPKAVTKVNGTLDLNPWDKELCIKKFTP
jgi:hypothetical protein